MTDKTQLIDKLCQAHEQTRQVIRSFPYPQEVYQGWTAKQFVAHLAGWTDAFLASLAAYQRGEIPQVAAPLGINNYNSQTVAEREELSLEKTILEWDHSNQEFIDVIQALTEQQLNGRIPAPWGLLDSVESLVLGLAEHEHEHAQEILAKVTP